MRREKNRPTREGCMLEDLPVERVVVKRSVSEMLSVSTGLIITHFTGLVAELKLQVSKETKCVNS